MCYSTQTSGRVARICIKDMYPAFADVTQVNDVKEEPRLQASSHVPSEQRRLGTESDRFRGDVTAEIAEDDGNEAG